jgi:cytochrome c-type biogenesis protein CcmH
MKIKKTGACWRFGRDSKNRGDSWRWGIAAVLCVGGSLTAVATGAGQVERMGVAHARQIRQDVPADRLVASRRGISGVVRIAPALVGRIASGDTLFVYAQALDGDPAPLVVLRKRAHELPVAFFLDDSIAINPARLPSSHNELLIGARVARGGSGALPSAGDLQGFSAPVRYGQAGVVIVIDSEVK